MSDCCGNHSNNNGKKSEKSGSEKPPESFVGKFLYNLGKSDYEKESKKRNYKKKCC